MPRRPRVFVEGGIYHVYNRFARGAEVFRDGDEADRFLELIRAVKRRDGLTVFAFCLMSNHYHVAVRTGPVPLARTMGYVQARFGQGYNRRWRSTGPLWQSRYKARLVEDERYLQQLIAYIHLNPVTARVVQDPAEHRFSGHRDVIGRRKAPLIDVEQVLAMFGDTVRTARAAYVRTLRGVIESTLKGEVPGRLPWWRHERDSAVEPEPPQAWVDELGRSSGLKRPPMTAEGFLAAACALLGAEPAALAGDGKGRELSRQRYLVAALGVERWGQQSKRLGELLGRRGDAVSRWVRHGAELRGSDSSFANDYEELDKALAAVRAAGPS